MGARLSPASAPRQPQRLQQHAVAHRRAARRARGGLGGDDLGGAPVGQRLAGGARRELEGAAPERADAGRADEAPAHRGLAVDLVRIAVRIGGNAVRVPGARDQAFQRVDGRSPGDREPLFFVGGDGHRADRARRSPRELRAVVGGGHGRKLVEARRQPRGALQRSRRHAEALARIVAQPNEPEPAVRPAAHERARRTAELAAHRRLVPTREPELEVQAGREARALRLQRAVGVGRRLPAWPSTIIRRGAPQPAHDSAQTEEAPRASGAVGRGDHLRTILDSIRDAISIVSDIDRRRIGESPSNVKIKSRGASAAGWS